MTSTNKDPLTQALNQFQAAMSEGGTPTPADCLVEAECLWRGGDLGGAEGALLRGLGVEPSHVELNHRLAALYLAVGHWDAAEPYLVTGLNAAPEHLEMLTNLAQVHRAKKKYLVARECLLKALEIDNHFMPAREELDLLFKDVVPEWHFSMMNDETRNSAYDAAIRAAVTPETVVLEIGTGAGLLAMMAARAGAKHVYTVEMVPVVAQTAREIIAANGLADRITVIEKNALALVVGQDLPERADLLIAEIFDAGFLGEGAVPCIQFARDALLKPNATVIPEGGTVYGALIESTELWQESAVDHAAGFDLGLFNRFQETKSAKYLSYYQHRAISEDVELFDFDFRGEPIQDAFKTLEVTVNQSGTCHLIGYWFVLRLDGQHQLTTKAGNQSCWRQGSQIIDPPRQFNAGDRAEILAQHNCDWIRLRMK